MSRFSTQYYPSLIPRTEADQYYEYLRYTIPWSDGIYSTRAGRVTRQAYSMPSTSIRTEYDRVLQGLITYCSARVTLPYSHITLGNYVNHYRNGQEWAPSHSHRGQVQMIVSLGTTRNLLIGSKTYPLHSGDVITFGSSTHQIPIQSKVSTGRISLATFMVPVTFPTPLVMLAEVFQRRENEYTSEAGNLTTRCLDELIENYTIQLSLLDR